MGSSSGQSNSYDLSFKVLLIGDSGVGKSSLLVSFISASTDDLAPTIGKFSVCFPRKKIKQRKMLWTKKISPFLFQLHYTSMGFFSLLIFSFSFLGCPWLFPTVTLGHFFELVKLDLYIIHKIFGFLSYFLASNQIWISGYKR